MNDASHLVVSLSNTEIEKKKTYLKYIDMATSI